MFATSHKLHVPKLGEVDIGLDWTAISNVESSVVQEEIKRLASSSNASWISYIYEYEADKTADFCVSLASKKEYKKPPVAGAKLIKSVFDKEQTFICLLKIEDGKYWFVGFNKGLPVSGSKNRSSDFVGDSAAVVDFATEFFIHDGHRGIPLYTDCPELFDETKAEYIDVKSFSLPILFEYIKEKQIKQAVFKRYSTIPVGKISVSVLVPLIAFAAYYFNDANKMQDLEAQRINRLRLDEENKIKFAHAISSAINVNKSANVIVPSYLNVLKGGLPIFIDGWKLKGIVCELDQCSLSYGSEKFATWAGYLRGKPVSWPEPIFDGDISVVTQPLPVELPAASNRASEDLLSVKELNLYLGNLAQISRVIGVDFSVTRNAAPVMPDGNWIPLKGEYTSAGNIEYLEGLVRRLPSVVGVKTLAITYGEDIKFTMNGEFYANP